jgi:hypothetical protein
MQPSTAITARRFNPTTLGQDTYAAIGLPWKPVVIDSAAQGAVYAVSPSDVFPVFARQEDANGVVLDAAGKQSWTMDDHPALQVSAFATLNQTYRAATTFAGRALEWGTRGQLRVNTDAFMGFNAFYSPTSRALSFGDVIYSGEADTRLMRILGSSDIVSHEAGHALHDVLKPNQSDWMSTLPLSFGQWGESFGDQVAMWSALQNPRFVEQFVNSFEGQTFDLSKSNALTKMGELATPFFGAPIRDAVNEFRLDDTSEEVHARSEVLTGAMYRVFQAVYNADVKGLMAANGHVGVSTQATTEEKKAALQSAGKTMGTLLFRSANFAPENFNSMQDVAKSLLTADEVHFDGRLHAALSSEFLRRNLLGEDDLKEWKLHRTAVKSLGLSTPKDDVQAYLDARLEAIIPGGKQRGFTLVPQARFSDDEGRECLRVQLVHTADGVPHLVGNHGLLAFSASRNGLPGGLLDLHSPFPRGLDPASADTLLRRAYAQGLGVDPSQPLVLTPMPAKRFDVSVGWFLREAAEEGHAMVIRSSTFATNPRGTKVTLPGMQKNHLGGAIE